MKAQPSSARTSEKPTITLYVRRGEAADPKIKTRTISIHPIPDKVSMDALLDMGFAFDGDNVSLGIDAYMEAREGKDGKPTFHWFGDEPALEPWQASWTLTHALRSVQLALVKWLRSLGYEVQMG